MTLKDTISQDITLLADDGYNSSCSIVRADFFETPETQLLHRKLRAVVETSIGYAKCFEAVVRRNKNFPELQELMILLAYELSQMKMMINPIREMSSIYRIYRYNFTR